MKPPYNTSVRHTRYVDDYRIRFEFSNGHATEIDFHSFLTQPGQNPMVTQFLDITRFKKFIIDGRADIIWGDWEMSFPFASLYAGDLSVDSIGKKKKVTRKPVRLQKRAPPLSNRSSRVAKVARTIKTR